MGFFFQFFVQNVVISHAKLGVNMNIGDSFLYRYFNFFSWQAGGAMQYQRDFNARQGMNRFQLQGQIGGLLAQGKSDAYAQGLGNVMGVQLTRQGQEQEMQMAQMAANATKDAGKKNLLGGIIQGGFGLLGGFAA